MTLTAENKELIDQSFKFGTNLRILAQYEPTSTYATRIGLQYQNYRIKLNDFTPIFPDDIDGGSIDINKSFYEHNYESHFIGIPISLIKYLKPKWKLNHFEVGIIKFYHIGNSGNSWLVESDIVRTNVNDFVDMNSNSLTNIFISIGKNHENIKRWKITSRHVWTNLYFSHSINYVFIETNQFQSKIKLWEIGLSSGITF